MSGLRETFENRIDFVLLDFDDSSLESLRRQLGITAQAQYVLVDADGNIAQRWFGVLDQSEVQAQIEGLLQT